MPLDCFSMSSPLFTPPHKHIQTHVCAHTHQKKNPVCYGADHQTTPLGKKGDTWILKLNHSFMKYLLHLYMEKPYAIYYMGNKNK